jgi:hypothetical protein
MKPLPLAINPKGTSPVGNHTPLADSSGETKPDANSETKEGTGPEEKEVPAEASSESEEAEHARA